MLAVLLFSGSNSERCRSDDAEVTHTNENNVLDHLRHVVSSSQSMNEERVGKIAGRLSCL